MNTYTSCKGFSEPSPTFMNTSSKVVTETPKLVIPYSSSLSRCKKQSVCYDLYRGDIQVHKNYQMLILSQQPFHYERGINCKYNTKLEISAMLSAVTDTFM